MKTELDKKLEQAEKRTDLFEKLAISLTIICIVFFCVVSYLYLKFT